MLMDNRNSSVPSFPLSMAKEGEWVRIVQTDGGQNLLRRLFAMGIVDGVDVEIIQHRSDSGVVIRVGDARWALGRGMAHKVLVCSIDAPTEN